MIRFVQRAFTTSPKLFKNAAKIPPTRYKLIESELDEKFTKGGGKGGQKINKSAHMVLLTHIPSGLQVKCQDTRSLEINRRIARDRLERLIEWEYYGMDSRKGKEISKIKRRNARSERRSKGKHTAKKDDLDNEEKLEKTIKDEKLLLHIKEFEQNQKDKHLN